MVCKAEIGIVLLRCLGPLATDVAKLLKWNLTNLEKARSPSLSCCRRRLNDLIAIGASQRIETGRLSATAIGSNFAIQPPI